MKKAKGKKKMGMFWVLLSIIGICGIILGILKYQEDKISTENPIISVEEFSRISSQDLISKMGEPDKVEIYDTYNLYFYDNETGHFEIKLVEDKVVNLNLFSNRYYWGTGENFFFGNNNNIPNLFNVTLSKNAKISDNRLNYKISMVSSKVASIKLTVIDTKEKTFGAVQIVYDTRVSE